MWRRELLDSPEVLRIVIDSVPTIVLVLDEQGCIAKVNNYFEKKTGYTAEEVVGKDWFAMFLPDEERQELRELFAAVMEQGINPGHINNIVTADGQHLSVEWFAKVITDPEQRARWLLNVGHDITERLEYERALEFERREAQRANATKTRFLTAASHDLRQPLQTLMILNEALSRVANGKEQNEMLDMQRDALHGMRELLNALLDIGKLESGAIHPSIRAVPVNEIFEFVRAELGPLADEQGLDLVIAPSPAVVSTDPALLMQLVQNVVGNAIRYTRHGSVKLSASAVADGLEISVADTGIGIEKDQLDLIFDEFYQVNALEHSGGLGLGLSIVKRLAELLGCNIKIESELGKGTTFTLRVPIATTEVSSTPSLHADQSESGTGRVLLVDDDVAVLAASRMLFEIAGFTVITATSPDEVRATLDSSAEPVDLIVTDYHLHSKCNGTDIVAAVRARQDETVPAIILSGDTSPKVRKADLTQLEVMSKPVLPDRLLAAVRRLLKGSPAASGRVGNKSN